MAMLYNVRCSILVVRKHAALLVHRTRGGLDDWVLPGGTPCEGESLMACARRELLEETGVSADPSRVAFVVESASPGAGRMLDIVFVASGPVLSREYCREPGMGPSFLSADQLPRVVIRPAITGQLIRLLDPGPQQPHAAYVRNRTAGTAPDEPPRQEPAMSESLARTRVPRWAGSWLPKRGRERSQLNGAGDGCGKGERRRSPALVASADRVPLRPTSWMRGHGQAAAEQVPAVRSVPPLGRPRGLLRGHG